jgi:hypothetical protein
MNYITIGHDCSPAAALRNMNLRKFALPFDWVQSNIKSIEACFREDFARYHTELKFNSKKTRLIDAYGFEFPHDYPLLSTDELQGPASGDIISHSDTLGEGAYEEKEIVENWLNFYNIVKEKYDRRIERFRTLMKDPAPIIVLSRYHKKEYIFRLKELFAEYYNKTNIRFINSSNQVFENDFMVNIHTEQNGEWNDTSIWQSAIDVLQ